MNTIIIGSGPAGYTAAIYAARADLNPIIYTGLEPGGQLTTTTDVDNFPGYPKGIDGPTMMNELKEQAERFGTEVKIDFISKVDFSKEKGGIHKLYTQNGDGNAIVHNIAVTPRAARLAAASLRAEAFMVRVSQTATKAPPRFAPSTSVIPTASGSASIATSSAACFSPLVDKTS